MLGLSAGKKLKFAKDFLSGNRSVLEAFTAYVNDVRGGKFPADENCF